MKKILVKLIAFTITTTLLSNCTSSTCRKSNDKEAKSEYTYECRFAGDMDDNPGTFG